MSIELMVDSIWKNEFIPSSLLIGVEFLRKGRIDQINLGNFLDHFETLSASGAFHLTIIRGCLKRNQNSLDLF